MNKLTGQHGRIHFNFIKRKTKVLTMLSYMQYINCVKPFTKFCNKGGNKIC